MKLVCCIFYCQNCAKEKAWSRAATTSLMFGHIVSMRYVTALLQIQLFVLQRSYTILQNRAHFVLLMMATSHSIIMKLSVLVSPKKSRNVSASQTMTATEFLRSFATTCFTINHIIQIRQFAASCAMLASKILMTFWIYAKVTALVVVRAKRVGD